MEWNGMEWNGIVLYNQEIKTQSHIVNSLTEIYPNTTSYEYRERFRLVWLK